MINIDNTNNINNSNNYNGLCMGLYNEAYDIIRGDCSSYNHYKCKKLNSIILDLVRYDFKFDNKFFDDIFNFITGYYKCFQHNNETFLRTIKLIFQELIPNESNMILLAKFDTTLDIFKLYVEAGMEISKNIYNSLVKYNNWIVLDYIIDYYDYDDYMLESICKFDPSQSYYYASHINNFINVVKKLMSKKLIIQEECLLTSITNDNNISSIVSNILLDNGCIVTNKSLDRACQFNNKKFIFRILSMGIKPDKNTYNSLIKNSKKSYDVPCAYNSHEIKHSINCLIKAGYVIDYDDVVEAIKYGCYIENIYKYDIDFKDEFTEVCSKYSYYPYDYTKLNINYTLNALYIECEKSNNLSYIKKIVDSGTKPDMECMLKACSVSQNSEVIEYFIKVHGIKPNIKCIEKSNNKYINPNINSIIELWNYEFIEPKSELEPESKPKSKNNYEKLAESLGLLDEFKEFNIDMSICSNNKNKNNTNNYNPNYKLINIDYSDKTPKNRRVKNIINNKIIKFFKIKDKKISFIDLKKKLLDYILKMNLIVKNKNYIQINDNLKKTLKVKIGYVKFADFDKLVSLFYN